MPMTPLITSSAINTWHTRTVALEGFTLTTTHITRVAPASPSGISWLKSSS